MFSFESFLWGVIFLSILQTLGLSVALWIWKKYCVEKKVQDCDDIKIKEIIRHYDYHADDLILSVNLKRDDALFATYGDYSPINNVHRSRDAIEVEYFLCQCSVFPEVYIKKKGNGNDQHLANLLSSFPNPLIECIQTYANPKRLLRVWIDPPTSFSHIYVLETINVAIDTNTKIYWLPGVDAEIFAALQKIYHFRPDIFVGSCFLPLAFPLRRHAAIPRDECNKLFPHLSSDEQDSLRSRLRRGNELVSQFDWDGICDYIKEHLPPSIYYECPKCQMISLTS